MLNPYLGVGLKNQNAPIKPCNFEFSQSLPDNLDYRENGKMSPVKSQGSCGSCYIFSAIASLESQYLLNSEATDLVFSEQAILNCMERGCNGGMQHWVWKYISDYGVPKQNVCPYVAMVCLAK